MQKINHIFSLKQWEQVQDSLSDLTGMAVLMVDYRGVPVTKHSHCCEFCRKVRESPVLKKYCEKCDSHGGAEAVRENRPYIYRCCFGLIDIAIPILSQDTYLGALMIGQVKTEGEKLESIVTLPDNMEIQKQLKGLQSDYESIPVLDFSEIRRSSDMLYQLCHYIVEREKKNDFKVNGGIAMRKAFICPTKYVQGENEILNLGYFVNTFGKSALLIAHPDDVERVKDMLEETAKRFQIRFVESGFYGECSRKEVLRLQELARKNKCQCTIGLGGGKAIDTAKCVAEGHNLIVVPTIAATDAPTSHSAVLYTTEGAFDDYAYFKKSPDVVLVDTRVIANAPVRFLVSGMGDALSTYFEARANVQSYSAVNAGLPCGYREKMCEKARGTTAAFALAQLCYQTLMEEGWKAKVSCENHVVTVALEKIVETNILLSGLGFESGGLAAAHAIHDGLTVLEGTHKYFHGEKVAFGTLAQLMLENAPMDEVESVLDFCLSIGLPVCLADIGVEQISDEELMQVAEKACIPEESIYAMPFPITVEAVIAAIKAADAVGLAYKRKAVR